MSMDVNRRHPGMNKVALEARRRIEDQGLSVAGAARQMRFSPGGLSAVLNGRTKTLTIRMASAMARVLGGTVGQWEAWAMGASKPKRFFKSVAANVLGSAIANGAWLIVAAA